MKPKCIAYSLHGSSTKAAGTAGAIVEAARSGWLPDAVIGVSGGAILAVPFALGKYDECLDYSRNVRMEDWFDVPVTNGAGKPSWAAIRRAIRSVWQAITGKKGGTYSLGVQNTARVLGRIVTAQDFAEYKSGNYAPCYIVSVDWHRRKLVVRNAKELTYTEYLNAVHASACLPGATQGAIFPNGALEFDGGLFSQNAAWWLLENAEWAGRVTDLISVYVTPNDNELPNLETPDNVGEAFYGALELMQNRLYEVDEANEIRLCAMLEVNRHEIRLPLVIGGGAGNKYNNSPVQLEYLQRMGRIEALKILSSV